MPYIDSNIFLYLADNKARKDFKEISERILKRVEGGESCTISVIILMEVLWWCEKHAKTRIKDVYDMLLSFDSIKILSLTPSIIDDAMFFKEKNKLELNDCISIATMATTGVVEIYSNDKGFDKIEWIKRTFK